MFSLRRTAPVPSIHSRLQAAISKGTKFLDQNSWKIEIKGLVDRPMTVSAAELIGMFALEERLYRHRCVEAWSIVVPWYGFPLAKLLDAVGVQPAAKFVKVHSVSVGAFVCCACVCACACVRAFASMSTGLHSHDLARPRGGTGDADWGVFACAAKLRQIGSICDARAMPSCSSDGFGFAFAASPSPSPLPFACACSRPLPSFDSIRCFASLCVCVCVYVCFCSSLRGRIQP